jgi:hypothetical protein
VKKRGFAAAVGSDQADAVASKKLQLQILDDRFAPRVVEADIVQAEQGGVRHYLPFPSNLNFLTCIAKDVLLDVWTWFTAVLAADLITTTVIRGRRLGAGHGRPARMSGSHAETSRIIFSAVLK